MSNVAIKERPDFFGLPRVSLELEEITPEQRRKGEQGTLRKIECAHSWLRGIVDVLIVYISNTDGTFQDIIDNTFTVDASDSQKLSFLFANTAVGVQVGTGTAAVDRDDFAMATPILDGSTAGRLVYTNPSTLTKAAAITGGYRIILERSFNNDSGGSITFNESGVAVVTRDITPAARVGPTILRDLISPGHVVVNGGAVIVRYFLDWLA